MLFLLYYNKYVLHYLKLKRKEKLFHKSWLHTISISTFYVDAINMRDLFHRKLTEVDEITS